MYLVLNCMPMLWVYNWKCRQKIPCPRIFMLFRYTRHKYIELTCVNFKWIISAYMPLISAFMKWSRSITVHLKPEVTKAKYYSKPWNPFPIIAYVCISHVHTHRRMHMFTKCTLLFTFNINEAFKKRFVPSIDKPERKKKPRWWW